MVCIACGLADDVPFCDGDPYGGPEIRRAIEHAMAFGSVEDVEAAIAAGKAARGAYVGCPEAGYPTGYIDSTPPELGEIRELWQTVHAPRLAAYQVDCPEVGRSWGSMALGGIYASLCGEHLSVDAIALVVELMVYQQYSEGFAPVPLVTHRGAYGALVVPASDPCYIQGVVGESVLQICEHYPWICVEYDDGRFAGSRFVVADIVPQQEVFDGGLAFDVGWAGTMMLEVARVHPQLDVRTDACRSLELAAQWALNEPPVRNHNYSAKVIWLLAQCYGLTGDCRYRAGLLDKLERNLLPGVLMDLDGDTMVDGMPDMPFEALHPNARIPGRMWDGHNALPWYHAMNAWALIEAYVAFRDHGDADQAQRIWPYAEAMLDNLAVEILTHGLVSGSQGLSQLPHALLLGIWKVADHEGRKKPRWEQAAWVAWNTGLAEHFGANTVDVGLYLVIRSRVPYRPLWQDAERCDWAAPEDLNLDGQVDGSDMDEMLERWSSRGAADLNCDGIIHAPDLSLLLSAWGDTHH